LTNLAEIQFHGEPSLCWVDRALAQRVIDVDKPSDAAHNPAAGRQLQIGWRLSYATSTVEDLVTTARTNGSGLRFNVYGNGEPILLLHGLFQSGSHWTERGYTPALRDRYSVVEVDLPGHGGSARCSAAADFDLQRQVAQLIEVLDDLGAHKTIVWGYSLGAWLASGLAAGAKERVTVTL
jgi:pimeloyl-ACP methyl ester carboxylesterase